MREVQVKVLNPSLVRDIPLPAHATEGSAGLDLRACIEEPIIIEPGKTELIGSGLAVDIKDRGLMAILVARSGLGVKKGIVIAQGAGIIDSDYHGEVFAALWNRSSEPYMLTPGERMCQMMFVPVVQAQLLVVDEFTTESGRGDGGFGSTGRH